VRRAQGAHPAPHRAPAEVQRRANVAVAAAGGDLQKDLPFHSAERGRRQAFAAGGVRRTRGGRQAVQQLRCDFAVKVDVLQVRQGVESIPL